MNSVLQLGATQSLIDAIETARSVQLDAYILANPRLIDALERAARRGAHVDVDLCGDPAGDQRVAKANTKTIRELQTQGVNVHVQLSEGPGSLHTKAAVVDGELFLDDRNWTENVWETVIRDNRPADVTAWRAQLSHSKIAQTKAEALHQEAALIARARGEDVIVSTESIGPGPIVDALVDRARRGSHVRVLFDDRLHTSGDAEALRRLEDAGVELRSTQAARKIACVGDSAWIGSANATRGGPERDWGMTLKGRLAQRLHAIAELTWHAAHPLVHGHP